ncbi:hypothetical protein KCP78_25750 [Salmonella enterica subsp. enterica]|nr:hypothetical protein KCP78_25750 [Salmonella enterica subsp. enterica]
MYVSAAASGGAGYRKSGKSNNPVTTIALTFMQPGRRCAHAFYDGIGH